MSFFLFMVVMASATATSTVTKYEMKQYNTGRWTIMESFEKR